ncbi:MAG: NAD-dependent epimerase/dehydratase family protein [Burkholderiales bacterium]
MKTLLIAGFGDLARRAAPRLEACYAVHALSRRHGFDLDRPETLGALPAAHAVLHCAPPPNAGVADTRTTHLLAALGKGRILPARVVYVSTSGVYGDCGGARVDESRHVHPQTDRARRRVDAERQLALWCSARGVALVILRAPGIYAADRLPLERLRLGTPVLRAEDDVYTNHIHAEDLAAVIVRALEDAAPGGTYNASDDSEMRMGDWFDLVAERAGLPRAPRIARSEAAGRIAPELLSFMSESRRLTNRRMKEGLGVRLRYRTVFEGVPHAAEAA